MALRDRISKALRLPAGATTQTEQQIAAQSPQSGTMAEPLPRDPNLAISPFPPAMPLIPALINQPRTDGRADPRRYEFPVAWNLQIVEQRTIPFRVLREVADGCDIVRKCVEVNKSIVAGMGWDITISEDAVTRIMAEEGVGSTEAASRAREMYAAQITLAKDFWRRPDRINGMNFQEWVSTALEEVLVIDALSIYPNKTMDDKDLHSLVILDGSTIKPLLSAHGNRPEPPHPAFQQILWGFPRGEFTASDKYDDEFTSDDLIYAPRNRRTFTPYGFSPVERALALVDLYMKRLHWFRTEFTDGVIPDLAVTTDIEFGANPQLIRAYEQVFNDEQAGNLEQRRRMRLFPKGFSPEVLLQSDAKYSDTFDNFLVKSICGHFGVLPTQIGFTPESGLGGKGHQDGEASSADAIGIKPLVAWVENLLNELSYGFLAMPRDLRFVFSETASEDEQIATQRRQQELFSGQKTWNEVRSEMGLPLFTFPEADSPLLVQAGNVLPLSAAFEAVGVEPETQDTGTVQDDSELDDAGKAELVKFVVWARTEKNRDFTFIHVDDDTATTLNELVKVDAPAAREYARKAGGVRPKVFRGEPFPKNHPARAKARLLATKYRDRFASVGRVDAEALATAWLSSSHSDPVLFLREQNVRVFGADAVKVLQDLYWEAGWMGWVSGSVLVARAKKAGKADEPSLTADWEGWEPGNPAKAERLWGENGTGTGLQELLDRAGVTIKGIDDTRINMIGQVLAKVSEQGLGVRDAAKAIRELAKSIDDVVVDASRAEMIAHTEMTRANTATQLDNYRENGASMVEWQTADANACPDCQKYEADNPYPIDAAPEPPEHPMCGCQLIPAGFEVEEALFGDNLELAFSPDLVKVERNAITEAHTRLDALPDDPDKPGHILVPWTHKHPRPKISTDDWSRSVLRSFKIADLCATQDYVRRDTVTWHLEHLNDAAHDNRGLPNVLETDKGNLIYDGHHRLVAYWLLGADYANCWTLKEKQ